jgi:DNA-binding NarL/FixJ family response regulator
MFAAPSYSQTRKAALSVRELREKTAVILDRHPLWLDAVERLLRGVGVIVVGKTTSPAAALELVEEARPTVFIAEFGALEQSEHGLATLRRATTCSPGIHSVVLSTTDDPVDIEATFAAGASVYCMKTAEPEDLASAIRQMFQSSIYYAGVRAEASEPAAPAPRLDTSGLTKREVEILQLVAEGYSNSQLAKMLWVTEQTVKFHLSNIYRKLEVANRTEASRWAQLHGLLAATGEAATAAA